MTSSAAYRLGAPWVPAKGDSVTVRGTMSVFARTLAAPRRRMTLHLWPGFQYVVHEVIDYGGMHSVCGVIVSRPRGTLRALLNLTDIAPYEGTEHAQRRTIRREGKKV